MSQRVLEGGCTLTKEEEVAWKAYQAAQKAAQKAYDEAIKSAAKALYEATGLRANQSN